MTACSRRNFVSGMGALILMTGTSVTSLAKEEKADKPKRYAMVHDETACIGCTACMDACRETNHVPEGVSRLEILRSEPYGEFPNQEYEFFRQSCQHCTNAPCVAVCPTGASRSLCRLPILCCSLSLPRTFHSPSTPYCG